LADLTALADSEVDFPPDNFTEVPQFDTKYQFQLFLVMFELLAKIAIFIGCLIQLIHSYLFYCYYCLLSALFLIIYIPTIYTVLVLAYRALMSEIKEFDLIMQSTCT